MTLVSSSAAVKNRIGTALPVRRTCSHTEKPVPVSYTHLGPGLEVYEGMIVGVSPKSEDIVVNVCKKKHVTNTRAAGSDEALKLVPPSILSLEQCLEFIKDDELVEVTPKSIRCLLYTSRCV